MAFYRDRLGFKVKVAHGDLPEFAIIGREGCDIFLKRADIPFEARHRHHVKGDWFYDAIFTANGAANVDALYEEFSAAGVPQINPPNTEHGMRVFSFLDPDGYKFWVHAMMD
jgi:catechol 2,3-dioxygenase-like lactoylglutathione lyase family enzyme